MVNIAPDGDGQSKPASPSDGRGSRLDRLRTHVGDRAFLATSTIMRMAAGLAAFMLLARGLGPVEFGLFSTVFAYSLIASFVTDFGYASKALRDIAADPSEGGPPLGQALSVKFLLTALVALVGGIVILLTPTDGATKAACALIGAGVLAASIGDLSLVAFRAKGRFAAEAWIVLWTSGVYALTLGVLAALHVSVAIVGVGLLVARLIYMGIALRAALALFSNVKLSLARAVSGLRSSLSWAADSGLGFVSGQIDGLFVAHMLGLGQAGLYQSGARFVQAALGLAGILSNIHIPRLASRGTARQALEWRMIAEFLGLGLICGLGLIIVGPFLTRYILGAQYQGVDALWLGFAAFIVARYAAAALGASLSAGARPGLRVVGQAAGLLTVVGGLILALPRWDVGAAAWVMAGGSLVTTLIYGVGAMTLRSKGSGDGAA